MIIKQIEERIEMYDEFDISDIEKAIVFTELKWVLELLRKQSCNNCKDNDDCDKVIALHYEVGEMGIKELNYCSHFEEAPSDKN